MSKAEQTEIPGTERKRIPAIERAAAKADAKRGVVGGLSDELKNLVAKLSEVMHANEDQLDKEETENGEKLIVYQRGDYKVVVKYKESVNYKIKKESKGEEGGEDDEE